MQFNQITQDTDQNKNVSLESQRDTIEKEFQNYCKVFLYKKGNDYAIYEWDIYFGWGERLFSLVELNSILNNYQKLEKLFPDLDLMPYHKIEKGQMH